MFKKTIQTTETYEITKNQIAELIAKELKYPIKDLTFDFLLEENGCEFEDYVEFKGAKVTRTLEKKG